MCTLSTYTLNLKLQLATACQPQDPLGAPLLPAQLQAEEATSILPGFAG